MKRLVSARARKMVLSCLITSSDDEDDDIPDFFDDSRSSSPIQLPSSCLTGKLNAENGASMHAETNFEDVQSNSNPAAWSKALSLAIISVEEATANATSTIKSMNNSDSFLIDSAAVKCIEPSSYFPLTPCAPAATSTTHDTATIAKSIEAPSYSPLPTSPPNAMSVSHDNQLKESSAEKSMEPPPYSPLTPCPATAISFSHENQLKESSAEKSIEPPPYSPLTPCPPKPKLFKHDGLLPQNSIETSAPCSPLPLMSPDTARLFNTLTESLDLDDDDSNVSTKSNSSNEVQPFDSDDSNKDPNYEEDYTSSDDSSNHSISFITNTTNAEIHLTPEERNVIPSSNPDTIILNHHSENIPLAAIETDSVQNTETTQIEENFVGRPKRGRKRKHGGFSREERKKRKYLNLPFVNSRKKAVTPKKFIDFKCKCSKKCNENISVEKRKAAFEKFYSLGSYNAQNMFLLALIQETPVKRHYIATDNKSNVSKKKSYSRVYFLDGVNGITVCRDMFVKTFQTSAKRINTSLCKMRSDNCVIDKRGLQSGHNKFSPESEQFVINVIKKLPTYISHYRRAKCGNEMKFLRPDMTFSKIYELYCDEAKVAGIKISSSSKVKQIFLEKFNLRHKSLKKDTCNKCDYFQSQIQHASEDNRADIEQKLMAHQQTAEKLQTQLKSDMKLAKNDPSVETITFDMEKTLPLPRIPTNIVFYKSQIWVYNLGIHTGSKDEAHCNVWVEGEAGRGAQEVGSCLIKHVTENLNSDVKRLILWSDSCGGQNRNIKLTLMLKAMLNEHPTLEQINMRFLESGHSFLPNDTDFGKIESALKHQQRLYTPDDYIQVMKTCKKKKPMHVHRMKNEDFMSSLKLEKNIINRKKTKEGERLSWLNTKEIMIKKDEMFTIYMRSNLEEDFKEVDIQKNVRGRQSVITKEIMEPLWPRGKPIPEAKLKDLKSLLHLIPQDSHDFYVKLVGSESIEDDLEGFSGQPDFEIEEVSNDF